MNKKQILHIPVGVTENPTVFRFDCVNWVDFDRDRDLANNFMMWLYWHAPCNFFDTLNARFLEYSNERTKFEERVKVESYIE